MSNAFTPIPAKPTFGNLKEKISQSDYINRKKGKYIYCTTPSFCNKPIKSNSYAMINSFNLGRYAINVENNNSIPVNRSNLIFGQYSKLDLNNVCTVSKGAPPNKYCSVENPCNPCQNPGTVIIDTSVTAEPFYFGQTIDPLGELFGSSQCGELNYTKYMVLNIPTV